MTGFVSQVSEGLSACEATFGKTGDQTIFIFIFMGEELKPLQHIDHARRNILGNIFPPALAAVRGS